MLATHIGHQPTIGGQIYHQPEVARPQARQLEATQSQARLRSRDPLGRCRWLPSNYYEQTTVLINSSNEQCQTSIPKMRRSKNLQTSFRPKIPLDCISPKFFKKIAKHYLHLIMDCGVPKPIAKGLPNAP